MAQFDVLELKAQLARRGMTQLDLARLLGHPSSTVAEWIRGARPGPADLVNRIEKVLGLSAGALTAAALHQNEKKR